MLDDRIILGRIYVGDNQNVIFTLYYEGDMPVSEIYLVDGECQYQLLLSDIDAVKKMNFNEHHQIYGTYRLRRGCEKTIYFTDNYNPPRYLNISDVNQFKIITGTNPLPQYGSADADKLRLQKVYDSIPQYSVEIKESGQLLPGSYNISIRYVDEDLNPTEWIETSEPVMIFHDKLSEDFSDIRASSNDVEYRKYGNTNKAIRVEVDNKSIDKSYIFVQIALIGANSGTGYVNDVVYSPLLERDFNNPDTNIVYLFTGGTHETEGSEDEVLANTVIYDRAGWLEQADNRLVMANLQEMNVDWCKLQKYASRITADCVYRRSKAADISSPDNTKNPMVLFNKGVGYQPGEIYSFGIVYVFENGAKSPVYHIPGKSHAYQNSHVFSQSGINKLGMLAESAPNVHDEYSNECSNTRYSDMAMSCEGFKYWGYDSHGDALSGMKVRHHRFPYRSDLEHVVPTIVDNSNRKLKLKYHYNLITGIAKSHYIKYKFKHNCETIFIRYDVKDDSAGVDNEEYTIDLDYKNKLAHGYTDVKFNCEQDYNHTVFGFHIKNGDTAGSNRTESELSYHSFTNKIKKYKQYKFVDIYESETFEVKFRKLQELPQLIHNDLGGIWQTSSMLTTGCTMVVRLTKEQQKEVGWELASAVLTGLVPGISVSNVLLGASIINFLNYREDNSSFLQNFGEDAFINQHLDNRFVVFDSNKTLKIRYSGKGETIDVDSVGGHDVINDNSVDSINWKESLTNCKNARQYSCVYHNYDKSPKPMNTVMGFHIEVKIEVEEQIDRKDLIDDYIFGIEFSNIEIPASKYLNGHKIVGYYIVQNERTEEDKTIFDSAVLTPVFSERDVTQSDTVNMLSQFRLFPTNESVTQNFLNSSFTEMFYRPEYRQEIYKKDLNLIDHLRKDIVGFINPEFKFHLHEYYNFSKIRIEGFYERNKITDPDVQYNVHKAGDEPMTHPLTGTVHTSFYSTNIDDSWITQDVQAGSSYNKKINRKKDKDNDGFDLHIFHKHTDAIYKPRTSVETTPKIITVDMKDIFYVRPLSFVEKEINGIKRTIYNASADNNAAFAILNGINAKDLFITAGNGTINRLPYAYLIKDQSDCDYYPDFKDRPYFTASEFMPFTTSARLADCIVYNGDCFISPMKYSTGMQYDIRMKKRGKKNTVWMYITGGLIIAGSLAGAAFTGGATLAAAGAGVALIQNGIKIDIAYKNAHNFSNKNGNKTINDTWLKTFADTDQLDDEIQWFFESVDGLFFESKVNMNWRCGATEYALTDYLNPIDGYEGRTFRDYYRNKLTNFDSEHEDGRMYLGYAKAEIYDINKDFERRNRQKMHYCIPITHRCCSECENSFPMRLVYSQQSFAEERTDNYKVFLPGNYKDIQGETGDITIVKFNGENAFMIFTEEGLYQLPCTGQQKTDKITQVVSFVGTGDYFTNDAVLFNYSDTNIGYGCKHKASFITTPYGSFWYSEHDNQVYGIFGGQKAPVPIFDVGMSRWFKRNGRLFMDDEYYKKYRTEYPYRDNPSSEVGTGYVLGWDNKYKRLLITKKDRYIPICQDMCHFNAKAITYNEQHVKDRIDTLADYGYKNICYKWNQEKCVWEIEYEGTIIYYFDVININENFWTEMTSSANIVYIDPVVFYKDADCTDEMDMTDSVINALAGSLDNSIVIASSDICSKVAATNSNVTTYSTTDDFETIIDMIANDYNDIRSTLGIIVDDVQKDDLFISYVSNFNDFEGLSSKREFHRNMDKLLCDFDGFRVNVIGIMPDVNERICATVESIFSDIEPDTTAIEQRIYVSEDISNSEHECPNYDNTLNQYLNELSSMMSDFKAMKEELESDVSEGYSVSQFSLLQELYRQYLTYTYFNTVSNSWDLTNSNGDRNLLAYYNANDTLKYDLENYVTNGMCADDADFNAVKVLWATKYLAETIDGSYFAEMFRRIYRLMLDNTHPEYYTHNTKVQNIANIVSSFARNTVSDSVNRNNRSVSDIEMYQALEEVKTPLGTMAANPVNIDLSAFFGDIYKDSDVYCFSGTNVNSAASYSGKRTLMGKTTMTTPQQVHTAGWRLNEEEIAYNDDFKTLCDLNEDEALFNEMVETFKAEHEDYEGIMPVFGGSLNGWSKECINNCYVYTKDGLMMSYCANIIDNSCTISFDPETMRFVSFHSYHPSIYVMTSDGFMTWKEGLNLLYRHNIRGSYLKFYDCYYPFAIETVSTTKTKAFGPEILNSVSIYTEADEYDKGSFMNRRGVFFDNGYFYNSRQCTGFKDFYVKPDSGYEYFDDYFDAEGKGMIPAERREKYWHINRFDDMVTHYDVPTHTESVLKKKAFMEDHNMNGWIDMALNDEKYFGVKEWYDMAPFRDMYVCQRYFYNKPMNDGNFENVRFMVILNTAQKTASLDNTL